MCCRAWVGLIAKEMIMTTKGIAEANEIQGVQNGNTITEWTSPVSPTRVHPEPATYELKSGTLGLLVSTEFEAVVQ